MVRLRGGCVVTIRQMLIGGSMNVGSNISYVGAASALATSVTPPTHVANDYLIAFAAGDVTSVPAGWIELGTDNYGSLAGTVYAACAYKKATGSSEVSGTWTGADRLLIVNYRGVASVGAATWWTGGSTTSYSGISLGTTDGTSWVVGICGQYSSTVSNAPTGMTNRTTVDSNKILLHDTASGVSAWNVQTVVTDASKSGTYVFELVST